MSEPFWPSRYGPDDEAGSLNEITPAKVVAAAGLVREGRIYDLAHVLDAGVPAFPGRTFRQDLLTFPHVVNARRPDAGPAGLGANSVNWIEERFEATSQIGTHMDGLNHLQQGDRIYNGHRLADIVEPYGTNRCGIESLPQVITRGLLVDVATHRRVAHLSAGDVIFPEEVEAILDHHGLAVQPGDAVFFHTGWGAQWGFDNAGYVSGEPGPGLALGEWLAAHRVAVTGCDTWSFGPVPAEDPGRPFEVPQRLNTRYGIVVCENLRLSDLASSGVSEFMLAIGHAKVRGGTGSWIAPLAVV
jgi:kynurenine formamidase